MHRVSYLSMRLMLWPDAVVHDEREQTLNQMLVEMDGFGVNQGIIVMAATNRVDILDPAIMRPGRFDRKIVVGRPDVAGREEILQVHAKNKPLGDDVDLKQIAQTTAGFTGADLENLLNEAAILAAKESRAYIQQADIQKAFINGELFHHRRISAANLHERARIFLIKAEIGPQQQQAGALSQRHAHRLPCTDMVLLRRN